VYATACIMMRIHLLNQSCSLMIFLRWLYSSPCTEKEFSYTFAQQN